MKTSLLVSLYCLISSVKTDNKLTAQFVMFVARILRTEGFTLTDVDISR